MIVPINLERLSGDGYKMNANSPTASTPSYITHAQLRYSPFTSSEAIQGAFVTGANSTVEFDVTGNNLYVPLKLYTSLNGTTYTEDKTYGGTNGVPCLPPSVLDPADFNGGVPRSNGSAFSNMGIDVGTATNDILVWNGAKWEKKTLAQAQAIIRTGNYKTWKGKISQTGTANPVIQQAYISDYGNPMFEYVGVGIYREKTAFPTGLVASKFHRYNETIPVYKNSNSAATTSLQGYLRLNINASNEFQIETFDTSFVPADGVIRFHQTIEFIYNN